MTSVPGTNQPFDANSVAPATGGGGQSLPVSPPEGWPVVITDVENKPTKNADGWYAEFTLRIIDGPQKDKTGVYRLNLGNASEETVRIAYGELSALCHVTGKMRYQDMRELCNSPFRAIVQIQSDPEFAAKGFTEVSGVRDINGNRAGKAAAPAAAAPTAPVAPVAPPMQQPAPAAVVPPPNQQWPATNQPPAAQPQPVQPAPQPNGQQPPWGQPPAQPAPTPPVAQPPGPQPGAPPWAAQ